MPPGGPAAAGPNPAQTAAKLALSPKGALLGKENVMSNMNDARGLRLPYGKVGSQYQTYLEPATSTIWGYFNPRESACFSLGLLKDVREHDNALAANGGKIEIDG